MYFTNEKNLIARRELAMKLHPVVQNMGSMLTRWVMVAKSLPTPRLSIASRSKSGVGTYVHVCSL
jgi:hypothetical protein